MTEALTFASLLDYTIVYVLVSAMAAGYGYEITSANDVLKMGAGEKESDQLRFAVLTGLVKVGQVGH